MVRIREAEASDWEQIWPFFREIVRAGETYAFAEDLTSAEAQELWWDGHVVVAVDEHGAVVGSAHMGPNRPGRGAHIGTASFMVSPSARGLGVGRALGEYCVAWHRAEGFHAIQFNAVVETNTVAVALWRSLGFRIIGTVPEAYDSAAHGLVGLHVMHLPLQ